MFGKKIKFDFLSLFFLYWGLFYYNPKQYVFMEKQQNNAANVQAMILAVVLLGIVVAGLWLQGVRL